MNAGPPRESDILRALRDSVSPEWRRGSLRCSGMLRPSRRRAGATRDEPGSLRAGERSHGRVRTRCCIVGGGPAGMMLGLGLGLLPARVLIDVTVVEIHADFLRDFRGDIIHPSTLDVTHELGLLEDFPHDELRQIGAQIGAEAVTVAHICRRAARLIQNGGRVAGRRPDAKGRVCDPRRSRHRLRRPPFDGAAQRRWSPASISARRWTRCGSGRRSLRAIPGKASAASRAAA